MGVKLKTEQDKFLFGKLADPNGRGGMVLLDEKGVHLGNWHVSLASGGSKGGLEGRAGCQLHFTLKENAKEK